MSFDRIKNQMSDVALHRDNRRVLSSTETLRPARIERSQYQAFGDQNQESGGDACHLLFEERGKGGQKQRGYEQPTREPADRQPNEPRAGAGIAEKLNHLQL